MEPQVNKILSRLGKAKTELKSEKVELGLMQDAISEYKKGVDIFQDARGMEDKIKDTYKDSLKFLKEAQKKSNKVKTNAKDLGVDIPKQTLNLFERIDSFVGEAEKKSK